MNRAMLLSLALAGCSAPAGSPPIGEGGQPIVNGTADSGDPATVYVNLGSGTCSGTLITPTTVLTAQHCTEGVSTSNMAVFFGSSLSGGGQWIDAVYHQDNPNGQPGGPGDLALITIAKPGPATPIPVNEKSLGGYVGATIRIVGFGVTSEDGIDSGKKRQGKTKILSVQKGLVFTGGPGAQTCYGDSGGPNFITIGGVEYVAAATSFGTDACGQGEDGAARTDDSIGWIKQYIAKNEKFGLPSCDKDGQCASGCSAPDPDCPCADDGHCTDACGDVTKDPDCAGCQKDGMCKADCPSVDEDCCGADGSCVAECKDLDPDCASGSGSSSESSGGSESANPGAGGASPKNGASPGATVDRSYTLGACSAGGGDGDLAWAMAVAGILAAARRRGKREVRS